MSLWGLPLKGHGESGLYTFCRWLAVPLFGGLYRCRAEGAANLPADGPAIVITNHKANLDPVVVGMIFDRPLRYMAKKELFSFAPLRKLIVTLGAFPLDRGAGDRAALSTSLDILAEGGVLLMFPEGHRRRDDAVHEFLPGVGMLALRSGAPVVPMAMEGTQRMFRGGRPGLPALRAKVGPLLDLSDLTGRNSKSYQEAARRMRAAVADLYAQL
ncbi:MAG: lysophospholipid acyltransferase family protein [Thermoleophilia bacterium]